MGSRRAFPVVIVDTPSLHRSSAALLLAPLTDLSLVVIEAEETAHGCRRQSDRTGRGGGRGRWRGVILNMRRFHIPRFIYTRI